MALEGGIQLQGSYKDNLGTLMLFEHQGQQGDPHAFFDVLINPKKLAMSMKPAVCRSAPPNSRLFLI